MIEAHYFKIATMHTESRKLKIIEELLRLKDEALLTEIEVLLEKGIIDRNHARSKPSDYAGCISQKEASELLQKVAESKSEWNRDF